MKMKFKVGIIGAGWVSQNRHIPSYKKLRNCELTSVFDSRPGIAEKVADKYKIKGKYSDVDSFFNERPDIVSICTSPWSHSQYAVQALKLGCHVLTEKPMAMSLAEVDEMVLASETSSRELSICHNFLFSRSVQRADELIRLGEVGELRNVIAVQLSSSNRRLPEWYNKLPGGLFYDESPHILYLIDHFIGGFKVNHATAERDNPSLPQSVSSINVNISAGGTSGSITMIFDSPISEWQLILVGSRKILCLDIFRDILITLGSDKTHLPRDVLRTSLSAMSQEIRGSAASGVRLISQGLYFGHDELIKRFVEAVDRNSNPPILPIQGRNIVKLQHEIIEQCSLI